jgi:hypothetical protein
VTAILVEIRGRVQTMSGPVDVLLDFDEVTGHASVMRAVDGEPEVGDAVVVLDEQTTAQIHMALESACSAGITT